MDFEAYRERVAKTGPHPGLSEWLQRTLLLYRCRDISGDEFRTRLITLSERLEKLLEQGLPENLEAETYQMASSYYDAVTKCLDSYLEGIDEILHWVETGEEAALDASRRCFLRGDGEWNITLSEALTMEQQFQEMDEALLRSLGSGGAAGY